MWGHQLIAVCGGGLERAAHVLLTRLMSFFVRIYSRSSKRRNAING